jgi:hypothetical protein
LKRENFKGKKGRGRKGERGRKRGRQPFVEEKVNQICVS